jgi:hypothetical protein
MWGAPLEWTIERAHTGCSVRPASSVAGGWEGWCGQRRSCRYHTLGEAPQNGMVKW